MRETETHARRPLPRLDLAAGFLRRGGPQGQDCRVYPGKDASLREATFSNPASLLTDQLRPCRDEEPTEEAHGHVTSISVLRNYRRLGLANKLMQLSRTFATRPWAESAWWRIRERNLADFRYSASAEQAMKTTYDAAYVSLHVRKTNRAALALYKDTLGFEVVKIEKNYCALLLGRRSCILLADVFPCAPVTCRRGWRGQ